MMHVGSRPHPMLLGKVTANSALYSSYWCTREQPMPYINECNSMEHLATTCQQMKGFGDQGNGDCLVCVQLPVSQSVRLRVSLLFSYSCLAGILRGTRS